MPRRSVPRSVYPGRRSARAPRDRRLGFTHGLGGTARRPAGVRGPGALRYFDTCSRGASKKSEETEMRRTISGAAFTAFIALSAAQVELAAAPALEGLTGTPGEWQQFGYDSAHRGVNPLETTIQPGNVATLHRLYRAPLPGLVNGAPVFLA